MKKEARRRRERKVVGRARKRKVKVELREKVKAEKAEEVEKPREIYLTWKERDTKAWASESFRKPWFALVERMGRLHKGEKLTKEEALFDPFFVRMKIDTRLVYALMKIGKFVKLVLGENATLFTVILSEDEERIIFSCIESEEDGIYTDYEILTPRLGKEWDAHLVELLKQNKMEDAFNHVKNWVKTQDDISHYNVGCIKVANILFFDAIRTAWEESNDGRNLPLFILKGAEAVTRILDEGWIRLFPDVPLQKFLRTMHPVLKNTSMLNKALQAVHSIPPARIVHERIYGAVMLSEKLFLALPV